MKIAVVTADGTHRSRHFGRVPLYVVFEIADGRVVSREVREKGYRHTARGGHEHQNITGIDGQPGQCASTSARPIITAR